VVELDIHAADVKSYRREGADLILHLQDGQEIVINNFFASSGEPSELVFVSDKGGFDWLDLNASNIPHEAAVDGSSAGGGVDVQPAFQHIDDVSVLLDQGSSGWQDWAPLALLGLGVAGAGIGAAVASSGGGGSSGSAPVNAIEPPAPTARSSGNSDGTVTVAGEGVPGSTVTVTYPDGSTGSATVGADGTYSITSPNPEPNGTITVTESINGQTSAPTQLNYTDGVAPYSPGVQVVGNGDGTVTVSGNAIPGSTVTVSEFRVRRHFATSAVRTGTLNPRSSAVKISPFSPAATILPSVTTSAPGDAAASSRQHASTFRHRRCAR